MANDATLPAARVSGRFVTRCLLRLIFTGIGGIASGVSIVSVVRVVTRGQMMAVNGMVVTSAQMAAQAGLRILQQGGNAFDAAVATAATMTVVEPLMSGLGGVGGYALIYDSKKQQVRALDFVGAAPAALNPQTLNQRAGRW